jgi:hypothetical protein
LQIHGLWKSAQRELELKSQELETLRSSRGNSFRVETNHSSYPGKSQTNYLAGQVDSNSSTATFEGELAAAAASVAAEANEWRSRAIGSEARLSAHRRPPEARSQHWPDTSGASGLADGLHGGRSLGGGGGIGAGASFLLLAPELPATAERRPLRAGDGGQRRGASAQGDADAAVAAAAATAERLLLDREHLEVRDPAGRTAM